MRASHHYAEPDRTQHGDSDHPFGDPVLSRPQPQSAQRPRAAHRSTFRNWGLALALLVTMATLASGCVTRQNPSKTEATTGPGFHEPPADGKPADQLRCRLDPSHPVVEGQGIAYVDGGRTHFFCCRECLAKFLKSPRR